MKKGIIGLLAAVMLLTAGTGVLAAGRGACRRDGGICRYPDRNGDGICDICGNVPGSGCGYCWNDGDGDGICDNAGTCVGLAGAGHHGGGCRR